MAGRAFSYTIKAMTGSPYGVTPGGSWQPPVGPPPSNLAAPKQSRALVTVSIVVALIAVAVAIASWFRPTEEQPTLQSDSQRSYTEEEIANSKKAVCEAHKLVDQATAVAGGETSEDPVVDFAIAINIRTTASLGAAYYFRALEEHPATPANLAEPVRELASTYQELLLLQIGKAPKEQLDTYYSRINSLDPKVIQACE